MITSYEVGAVMKLIDQFSAPLEKMSKKVALFDDQLTAVVKKIGLLDRAFLGLKGSAPGTGDAMAAAFGKVDLAVAESVRGLKALQAEMVAASRTSREIGAAAAVAGTGGLRRGHGGGGGGGIGFSGLSAGLPGHGPRMHLGGSAALALFGGVGYAAMEEAEIRDIIARGMITGQLPVDAGMSQTETFRKLRNVIQRNAALGGFSPKEVGEAVLGSERQFAGLSFDKRMEVLNTMLPYAMQESRLKETGLKEPAESLVGLSHMTGTYDPDKLPELYRQFAYASQLTPKSLPEYTRALSYAMPSLVGGMGMDPNTIMFLTAMNQSAGIGSSKAGTWIQAFFSRLMPQTGVDLTKSQVKHNEALRNLGLIDEAGHLTWQVKGAGGRTDWLASLMKLSPLLGDKLAGMPEVSRMQIIDQIFGKQGGREAGLFNLPEFIGQFPKLAQQLRMAQGGEDVLKQLGDASPVMQVRKTWSELQNVLMDIGTVVLPPVIGGLKILDTVLQAIGGTVNKVDSLLGHSAESDKLMNRGGDWGWLGLPSAIGHLGDAFHHLFGSPADASTMKNLTDIEKQRRERAKAVDNLADLPAGSPMSSSGAASGLFKVPGFGWTDRNGNPQADAIFGSEANAQTMKNLTDIEKQRRERAKAVDNLADMPGPSGAGASDLFKPWTDSNGNPQADAVHDGVLRALKDWGGGGGGGGGAGGLGGGGGGGAFIDGAGGGAPMLHGSLRRGHPAITAITEALGPSGPQGGAVDSAMKLLGMHAREDRGALMNFMSQGGVHMDPSVLAWCAGFVNASLAHQGIRGSGSLMANSFRNWGLPVAPGDVHKGDVMVVLGGRHVGMATGRVSGHLIEMLSGNTGGQRGDRQVGTGWYDEHSAIIRRAPQGGGGMHRQGHVYLDSKKVGKVMWAALERGAQGPSHGSQTPDGSRGTYGSGSSYNSSFV
jgi:TP901 family phage tail tape measure protein